MNHIPRTPLLLGLAGLVPFLWSALTQLSPTLMTWSTRTLGAPMSGSDVGLAYGVVILSFMSGVLWGFSVRATGPFAPWSYGLSVLPALWAFFMSGMHAHELATGLMVGFVGLLALDWLFAAQGLTPAWWMRLRVLLTATVVGCLAVTAVA